MDLFLLTAVTTDAKSTSMSARWENLNVSQMKTKYIHGKILI
jgi:hypothetical protein